MNSSMPGPSEPQAPATAEQGVGGAWVRRLPTAVMGAAVLAVAGFVAVVSPDTPIWASWRTGDVDRSAMLARLGIVVGLGSVAVLGLTLLRHRALTRRGVAPPLRTTVRRALPWASVALAALCLLTIARMGPEAGGGVDDGPGRATEASDRAGSLWGILDFRNSAAREGEDNRVPTQPGEFMPESTTWPMSFPAIAGIIAAVLVGALLWWWGTRRSSPAESVREEVESPPDPPREAVRAALLDTIDAMLADPEPNTAIIGAYARLLAGLADRGVGRWQHEAPVQHLQRVLSSLDVRPEPLRRLIELFQLARFSTHPLTAAHRDQALEALRAASMDLAAAGRPVAGGAVRVDSPATGAG